MKMTNWKSYKNINFINIKIEINFSLADGLLDAEADTRTDRLSGVVFFSDIFVGFDMRSFFFLKISDVNTLASSL